jgi:hypothetical protein
MGVCVVSSIVIPLAKTHSSSIGSQGRCAGKRAAFGKENKHALDHHAAPTLPARPILRKCQGFRAIAESMQGSFLLRKEPLEWFNSTLH